MNTADLPLFEAAARYPEGPGYANDSTSKAAAEQFAPKAETIRAHVLNAARSFGSDGFVDEELYHLPLLSRDRQHFERSVRPRRTELTNQGWLVDSGRRREVNGNAQIVWVHRDYHPSPPPLRKLEQPRSRAELLAEIATLKARIAELEARQC